MEDTGTGIAVPRWASLLLIVAVNLIPVYFLATGSWEPGDVLVAYWLENIVVGVFSLFKILTARGAARASDKPITATWTVGDGRTRSVVRADSPGARVGLAAFFVVHFGIFTVVHGVFTGLLAVAIGMSGSLREWTVMVLALIASYGISTWLHWIRGGERDRVSAGQAMAAPYGRIVMLHLVVLGSFFFVFFVLLGLNDPGGMTGGFFGGADRTAGGRFVPALALIAVKTGVDVIAELRQHRRHDRPVHF